MKDNTLTLTEETLLRLVKNLNDTSLLETYIQKAINNELIFPNADSTIKFLMVLVQHFDKKMFCEVRIDPLDFFGISNFDENNKYYKYHLLLKKTRNELVYCLNNGVCIPSAVIADFYARYAHAMFTFGNHLTAIELCQESLKFDSDNSLSLLIKSSIIEYCRINQNHIFNEIALVNYQKTLIDQCNPTKAWIDERIYAAIYDVIEQKMSGFDELSKCLKLKLAAENYEKTKELDPSWTIEKDFYLRNNLFLNPLNVFDRFIAAQNEDLIVLTEDEKINEYFDEILEDYKMCRKALFDFSQGFQPDKRQMAMIYSYAYTIFDKIAFVIRETYQLETDNKPLYFNKRLFSLKQQSSNLKFGEIKNDNILPLYLLAIDINDNSPTNQEDEQPVLSIESLKMRLTRNQIEHRSIALVEEDTLRSNMLILLKLARNTILHAFMLIHSCSVSAIEGKATTIGTTFYQAILNIVKENIHKDLIT